MYYPVKNFTQISSTYGYRELYGRAQFHNGIDIPVPENTKVYSTLSGVVIFVGFDNSGYGNCVIILHNNGFKSLYGHLSENFILNLGDTVLTNQLIAFVGPKILSNGKFNGNTTGVHLHFSIFNSDGKSVDPNTFVYEKK